MGIWGFLFGRRQPRRAIIEGDGDFAFDVVGESRYQMELELIVGRRTKDGAEYYCAALLTPEPRNKHDRNAVAVQIRDKTVGYISRESAPTIKAALKRARIDQGICRAVIVGGWDDGKGDRGHFGVRLDICLPLEFRQE